MLIVSRRRSVVMFRFSKVNALAKWGAPQKVLLQGGSDVFSFGGCIRPCPPSFEVILLGLGFVFFFRKGRQCHGRASQTGPARHRRCAPQALGHRRAPRHGHPSSAAPSGKPHSHGIGGLCLFGFGVLGHHVPHPVHLLRDPVLRPVSTLADQKQSTARWLVVQTSLWV